MSGQWTEDDVTDMAVYIAGELAMAEAHRKAQKPDAIARALLRMLAENGRLRPVREPGDVECGEADL